jgi:lauroyl/myristoyl acyltransferase
VSAAVAARDRARATGGALRELVGYLTYATIARAGRVLPTGLGRRLFTWGGTLAWHLLERRRRVVADNLARVLGRSPDDPLVQATTREAFRRYARYWFDAFDVATWPADRVLAAFRFEGLERIERALATGRGAIAVIPHIGNWDAAGRALSLRGVPVLAPAERLRPEPLFELFCAHRRSLGMEIVPADEGVGRALAAALARGRLVALVADRDLAGRGVEVEMFGARRRLPAGPAQLALQTGAPLFPAAIYEVPGGWRAVIGEPLEPTRSGDRRADVEALTRRIARAFERAIAASPADWHLFQPGWGP